MSAEIKNIDKCKSVMVTNYLNALLGRNILKSVSLGGNKTVNSSKVEQEVILMFTDYESLKTFNNFSFKQAIENFILSVLDGTHVNKHW